MHKAIGKSQHLPTAIAQGKLWADDDDEASDSDENDLNDDDDFCDEVPSAHNGMGNWVSLVNQLQGEPSSAELIRVIARLRTDIQVQRRKWCRAAEDTAALLQRFACNGYTSPR